MILEVSGGSKDQPVGRALYCSDKLLIALGGDAIPASFCKRIEPDPEKVDGKFLYYFLKAIYDDRRISQWQVQSTGISNFQFEAFLDECEIDLPTLDVQRRIASILSTYDDLIENDTRRTAILEEMARRIYEEWFVRFRFPGHKDVKMVESELGRIPEGWSVQTVDAIVEEIIDYRGKTPAKLGGEWSTEGVLAISALNVKRGRLINLEKSRFVSEELYKKWMKTPLRQGDILMTSEAPLGELFLLLGKTRYCLSQRVFGIRANPKIICPTLLHLQLSSANAQSELRSRATGATVSGIRQAELRQVPLVIPPRKLQTTAESVLSKLLRLASNLNDSCSRLRATRDLLLPKLLSGELDVSTLPEPEAIAA